MLRPVSWSLIAIAPAAVLLACSKPSSEAGPATTSTASASAPAPAAFDVEGFCEKIMALPEGRRCGADDEVREQNKVGYCGTLLRELRDGGKVRFVSSAAKPCVQAVGAAKPPLSDSRTVQEVGARLEACRKVIVGKQAAGAECASSVECAPGLACTSGKCAARVAVGKPCEAVREVSLAGVTSTCAAGLDCIDGACVEQAATGSVEAKGACSTDVACAAGHFCEGKPKSCQPTKAAGAACSSSRECRGRCSKADGKCVDYCGSG
ncbi:MAG: hypothetical protein JRI23_22645 [Deltaproteobacteria bacterium]|nr:hypothetical protein [Deltaproteobacteria bacterium]MBW2534767.1 hypothetical protein [Deltaproteobacteria bacterium]